MESIRNFIYNAASNGKLDILRITLYNKSKVEVSELLSPSFDGSTSLMVACKNGHLKVVQYLICECHVNVEEVGMITINDKHNEGVSPLWCAAAAGHLNIVKTLIECKASVDSPSRSNSTPLRAACYQGNFEIVKYLIEKGADINVVNSQGQTCLMAALYKKYYEIGDYLIKCGASLDAKDIYGNSALSICVALRDVEMAKSLIELGVNVEVAGCSRNLSELLYPCIEGTTPLLMACKDGELEVVQYLIQKCHTDVEEVGIIAIDGEKVEGVSPLWCAAALGHLDIAKVLIEHNASVNSCSVTKSTPLRAACFKGNFKMVKYLIQEGANINFSNSIGSTCLHVALHNKHNDIVKYLVACGAELNVQDVNGYGVLHICVELQSLEMTKYLVEHGVDLEMTNGYGVTCLILASHRKYNKIFEYLLVCGANVNRKTLKGNTALHEYAQSNDLEMVNMLHGKGAKIYEDSTGATPLLIAALNGHASIVKFFINNYKISKVEKVNAYELLGAALVDKTDDKNAALQYWEEAMSLRYQSYEFPTEKVIASSSLASYLNTNEVCTISGLKNLYTVDSYEMKKQSLLVRERILGVTHAETIFYIRAMGANRETSIEDCIKLWIFALEVLQEDKKPLSLKTYVIFRILTELFSYMMVKILIVINKGLVSVYFHSALYVFQRILKEIERSFKIPRLEESEYTSSFSNIVNMAVHHVGIMSALLPYLNKIEITELKNAVYKFVHLNPVILNGHTPLHLACVENPKHETKFPFFVYPSLGIIELLLEAGACPNTIDEEHNTPFHLAAMSPLCSVDMLDLLISHGAHLDNRNLNNQTALEITNLKPSIDVSPSRHLNLQCLCAQAINTYRIPYKDIVPRKITEFLSSHCSH